MIVVGSGRQRHVCGEIRKIEGELIGDDRAEFLRSRTEHHVLEGTNDGPQPIVLSVK